MFRGQVTAASVRRSRPTLFLAILAAASGSDRPSLFRDLNTELFRVLAQKVVMDNEKTLELVQAMLIIAVWYFPPDRFEELKHYQYIHMGATMAVDIGLCESNSDQLSIKENPASTSSSSQPNSTIAESSTTERCRTLLACYLLCSG